jgi:hypothetical protein
MWKKSPGNTNYIVNILITQDDVLYLEICQQGRIKCDTSTLYRRTRLYVFEGKLLHSHLYDNTN